MRLSIVTAVPHPVPHALLGEALLRPVRGHHAFEACVEQLGTAIRLGVYPLGATLPSERELAERLSVSRATLREAMAALREAGLIETRRGRRGGAFVTLKPKTPAARMAASTTAEQRAEWRDALIFRRMVEPGAAYQAAAADLSETQRGRLLAVHASVAASKSRAEHRLADSRFHLTIAALTESGRTIEAVQSVQSSLHDMLSAIPVLETNIAHSHGQHHDVVEAILAGHRERAREVMEDHCDDTAALLRGLVG